MDDKELSKERARISRTFPQCVAVIDEYRSVFGPNVKALYVCEAGQEMGKPREGGIVVTAAHMVIEPKEVAPTPKPTRKRWKDCA